MKTAAILPFILLAAACTDGAGSNDAQPTPADTFVLSDDETVAVGNIVEKEPSPAPTTGGANTFPSAFQGRWGIGVIDCDPDRDDNKGLMTISADTLEFYESRAKLDRLTIDAATKVNADLDWSGEGQTWRTTTSFTLSDGAKTLVRDSAEGATRYSKCAN